MNIWINDDGYAFHIFEYIRERESSIIGLEIYCSVIERYIPLNNRVEESFAKSRSRLLEPWEVVKYKLEGKI